MGNCAASHSHITKTQNGETKDFPTAKVIHPDGRLEEFRWPITAAEILIHHQDFFLCCSDTMLLDTNAPHLPPDHVLEFGQIYFLLPLSKSLSPLSLQEFCALAIKASSAIKISSGIHLNENTKSGRHRHDDCRDIAVTL